MATLELESKVTNSIEKEKSRLIDGLFYSVWSDEVAQFNGSFHFSKGEGNNSIEGMLQDVYGQSRIEGLLSENEALSFNKTYRGRPPITYKFSFDEEKGLYIGAWSGLDAYNGYSVCKLDEQLTQPDVDIILTYFKSFDPMTDEQKTQEIINYMVEKGDLYESKNPDTGETILGLTAKGKESARKAEETLTPEEKRRINEALKKFPEEDAPLDEEDLPF